MVDWVIERLAGHHEREAFCCGDASLDLFLQTLASQYARRKLGRTFVAVRPGEKRVQGFYTSATGSFALTALPEPARKKLPRHPLPTVHLGRLAVDQSCQRQGLGETLLFHFLHAALATAEKVGVYAVDVLATTDRAKAFYLKYGFIPLQDAPLHLYLPMMTVEEMFATDEEP